MKFKYTYLIFFLISMIFLSFHITNIANIYFDETHYIAAARQWLLMNPTTNLEHPPLGKYLIAIGIRLFGEIPLGWRISSIICGAISIATIFLIAEIIFTDLLISALISLFSLFNFWFFVQSRIGMLDIFMVTFILLAIYFYLKSHKFDFVFYTSAIFWGLAVAIKWSAVFIYIPFLFTILFNSRTLKTVGALIIFGLISIFIYFLTFVPYLFVTGKYLMTIYEIIFVTPMTMLNLQKSVGGTHPYSSQWYTWPLMIRPIWYEFIQSPDKSTFRGIVLLGNPFQMFLGIISSFWIVSRLKHLKKITQATLFMFIASWVMWAIAPRKIAFFYYFFPSAIFYSFLIPMSITETFSKKNSQYIMIFITAISFGFFIYFYPILSGQEVLEIERTKWYWLQSWI